MDRGRRGGEQHPAIRAAFGSIVAAAIKDQAAQEVLSRFIAARTATMTVIVRRAAQRGDLPDGTAAVCDRMLVEVRVPENLGAMTTTPQFPTTVLSSRFDGQVLTPGAPGYDSARSVWNAMIDHCPKLIVRCASTTTSPPLGAERGFRRGSGLAAIGLPP